MAHVSTLMRSERNQEPVLAIVTAKLSLDEMGVGDY